MMLHARRAERPAAAAQQRSRPRRLAVHAQHAQQAQSQPDDPHIHQKQQLARWLPQLDRRTAGSSSSSASSSSSPRSSSSSSSSHPVPWPAQLHAAAQQLAGGALLAGALALAGCCRPPAAVAATQPRAQPQPLQQLAASPGSSTQLPGPPASLPPPAPPPAPLPASSADVNELLGYERAAVALFEAIKPSVVNISLLRSTASFHTLDVHNLSVGQGSGWLFDRGHVVTNWHTIRGASEVKVTLHDHSTSTARVVGYDQHKDLAVLKLALPRGRLEALQPATLGSSSGLRVGQACFAVGNPFGLDHSLSQGIISGLGREMSSGVVAIKGLIQTDAAINPGNSGGVLLNSSGAVIGLPLAFADPSGKGSFSGVGYAVPIDTVKGLVEQILAHGRVRRPTLGITIAPEQVLSQLGIEGVLLLEVPAGSPAAASGLRPTYRDVFGSIVLGDIIVGMDTRPIRSTADLIAALDERRAGDKARFDVLRDGKRLSMTVTLGERGMHCE